MKRLRKRIREKRKISLSEYFKELKIGEKVAFVPELSIPRNFDRSYIGLIGIVKGKRGKNYVVEVKKGKKTKTIITHAVHLRRV